MVRFAVEALRIFLYNAMADGSHPLSDGCLAGVMRAESIRRGLVHEQSLSPKPQPDDQWLLINSLSCHPISHVNNEPLKINGEAEAFWRSLLHSHP